MAVGLLFTSGAAFIHAQFPGVPDFFLGLSDGLGIALMIFGLMQLKKAERTAPSSADDDGANNGK